MSEKVVINAMRFWVDDVVIHHNFCPFARFVRHPETIHYQVCTHDNVADIMVALHSACVQLDETAEIATTLLMVPALRRFDDYLDALSLAQAMLAQWQYEGIYQLASFHPEYEFEGEAESSPSHFTNRAPYPTFHLIREADITRALKDYANPDAIFEANISRAEALGCKHLQAQLNHCIKKAQDKA
ncbi:DUF1415 domain-containing protein [Salinimonas sp. HHU 13199]|uniref:DUF1415 domain-containing protein n=1 Tax=Salinimonas profundi TaxID=2729140 RepID=A0ABR8LM52_9ALTE|nr:DUF1415 domain-containing protein [Salinimonas profundi]MBD3587275.1 DUF1415 domain-containing protein [Salinimonas profundi]